MRHTAIITTGWCGFGCTRGLFPEIRLGIVAIGWCRGSLRDHVAAKIADIYAATNKGMAGMLKTRERER